MKVKNHSTYHGFTLLELLIVIGVLAILSAVVTLVLNPVEQLKKARDARRISDLSTINRALGYFESEKGGASEGNPNTVYTSLPDTSATCANYTLPTLPSGWTYNCVASQNFRNTDATGWIPVNFKSASFGSPFAALPIDPQNNTTYYYTYVTGGSWALSALLESQKQLQEQAAKDGGYNPGKFEVGSDLKLIAQSEGLVGWWAFDEGAGTIAKDSSGNNNQGNLANDPTWQASSNCKAGQCLSFDNLNDYVAVPSTSSLKYTGGNFTLSAWIKADLTEVEGQIFSKPWNSSGQYNYNFQFGPETDTLVFNLFGNSSFGMGTASGVVPKNVWHYIVATVNSSGNAKIYVDGVEKASGTYGITGWTPPFGDSELSLVIGSLYPYGGGWAGVAVYTFGGLIDEVRIYNRALSAAEIKVIYEATK